MFDLMSESRYRWRNENKTPMQLPPSITSERLDPGLYLIATPIGNLGDITLRALHGLMNLDVVYAEDTRVTKKLLTAYGIHRQLGIYHDHNGEKMRPQILEQLAAGKSIGIVTDAGTPLISDPGHKLVNVALEKGHRVTTFPGVCAAIAGLSISGLPADVFRFCGFLPAQQKARAAKLTELKLVRETLIFYESANRLEETLVAVHENFGARQICIARELTKKFEETIRGSVDEILTKFSEITLKGEIVLLVAGAEKAIATDAEIVDTLRNLLKENSVKDAAKLAAEQFNLPRQDMYTRALKLKDAD